jgi:hypothetical protein
MRRLKVRHWTAIALLVLVLLPCLWFALAYGGLPRLWSHHEHRLMTGRSEIVSYTAQDIPGDPINLRLIGRETDIDCAFARAGWSRADNVSLRSGLRIAASVLLNRPYPQAPVSPLYVKDRVEDLAFQRDEGRSADRRHHVRLWRIGNDDWLGAASFDRGVGISLFTLQITHHIGPEVDRERDMVGALLARSDGRDSGSVRSGIKGDHWHRNGGGDRYRTDGTIRIFDVGSHCTHA